LKLEENDDVQCESLAVTLIDILLVASYYMQCRFCFFFSSPFTILFCDTTTILYHFLDSYNDYQNTVKSFSMGQGEAHGAIL
jgi:hypothetical protein